MFVCVCVFVGEGEEIGTQVMLLKKQLQDLRDDRDTLKATIQRLTTELSRYQGKYRPPSTDVSTFLLVNTNTMTSQSHLHSGNHLCF